MSAPLTAKIGIVSAQKHCKTHLEGLRSDGLDVVCLGDKVNDIPDTIGIILVRVASSSHSAVSVARTWGKDTGRPVLYENGLSGMRRALSGLIQTDKVPSLPDSTSPEIGERLEYLIDAGKLLLTYQHDLSVDALTQHLIKVFWEKYPKGPRSLAYLANTAATMIVPPSDAPEKDEAFTEHSPSNTTTTDSENTMPSTAAAFIPSYAGSPAILPDVKWAKVYAEPNIRGSYDEAVKIITEANHLTISSFSKSIKAGVFSRKVKTRWENLLRGKPLTSAFVLFMLIPDLTKTEAMQAYRLITEKGMDSRLKDVVEWALGRGEPVVKNTVPEKAEESREITDNTKAILEVMDDFSALKSRVEALEEGNEDPSWEDRHDLLLTALGEVQRRVTALKRAGVVESEGEAEWEERFAQMKEDLRGDLSDAFDALAAERQAASGNPFAALEQVKAVLKAAGFKGTLTLTIE